MVPLNLQEKWKTLDWFKQLQICYVNLYQQTINTWSLSNETALCLHAYQLAMYFNATPSIGTGWLDYELYRHSPFYLRSIKTSGFTHRRCDNQTLAGWCLKLAFKINCRISANSLLPSIVSPFNSFCSNHSIFELKNCHNSETIWKTHFPLSKKNSFCGLLIMS